MAPARTATSSPASSTRPMRAPTSSSCPSATPASPRPPGGDRPRWASGSVLVAATGNDGSSVATFPAGDRGVVGVTSTDSSDALASGANFGQAAFLAAPGVDIATTGAGGGLATISRRPAAASVAGAAALLRRTSRSCPTGSSSRASHAPPIPPATRLRPATAASTSRARSVMPRLMSCSRQAPRRSEVEAQLSGRTSQRGTPRRPGRSGAAAGNPPISGATITATCTGGCGETATSGLTGAYAFAGGNRINYPGNGPITITDGIGAGLHVRKPDVYRHQPVGSSKPELLLSPANTAPTCTDPQSGSTNEDTR